MNFTQSQIIARVKELAQDDGDVSAVLMYGSFTKGEGDLWSDVEFYVFCRNEVTPLDWVRRVMPVSLFFRNEFGTDIAIFDNMIRGEFHFKGVDGIAEIESWQGFSSFEHAENMILVDKDGRLASVLSGIDRARPKRNTPENIAWLADSLINNLLHVQNLLCRGEAAQAHLHFQYILKYLLWLTRIVAGNDDHWEGPAKNLEHEIPPGRYQDYAVCAPALTFGSLLQCFDNALLLAANLFDSLKVPDGTRALLQKVTGRQREFMPAATEITRHYDQVKDENPWGHGKPIEETPEVVAYDHTWPGIYKTLAGAIEEKLGPKALTLEHVGSTSVPGLGAKPVIDIDLTVEDPADEAEYVPLLEALGYDLIIREPSWHQHRCLRLEKPRANLHVFGPGCPETIRHKLFRDWLRGHPEDRDLYEKVKLTAREGAGNVEEYNQRKQSVIREIYSRAFRAAGLV